MYEGVSIIIRKDQWEPSNPWFADLLFPDGVYIRNWGIGYKSKKNLLSSISSEVLDKCKIIRDKTEDNLKNKFDIKLISLIKQRQSNIINRIK